VKRIVTVHQSRTPAISALALWISAAVLSSGCHDQPVPAAHQDESYRTREEGSQVMPTAEASFQLMGVDGPARHSAFREYIISSGHECASVTSAVLVGGLGGTDEWRVNCSNTGSWSVWFGPEKMDVRQSSAQ